MAATHRLIDFGFGSMW